MTVTLLFPYSDYAAGQTVTLDRSTERALVQQNRARVSGEINPYHNQPFESVQGDQRSLASNLPAALVDPLASTGINIRNLKSSNTLRIRAAMARLDRGANVALIGPSTTRGQSTGGGTSQAINAWPSRLATMLRAQGIPASAGNFFGNANGWALGVTAANFLSGESRVTLTGTAAPTGFNTVGGNGFAIPAGSTLAFTPQDNATKADIYWRDNGTGKTFSWSVDGGAATNVASTGATTPQRTTINLGASGPHTITLAQVAGTPQIIGIHAYDDTAGRREINLLNWGIPGATSTQLLGDAEPVAGRQAMLATVAPDLTVIDDWPINDWRQSFSIDTTIANTTAAIALAQQTGDVLVTLPLWDGGTTGQTSQQDRYTAALLQVASAADVPVLDVRSAWVSYAAAQAAGFYSDTVHPTAIGYGVKANGMAEMFRRLRGI